MTYLKKTNTDWQPQEHKGILVGDVVDFGGPYQKLIEEGNAVLCDKDGNEISAYDVLGIITNRELEEFRTYKESLKQSALKKSLESEKEELLAEAEAIKAEKATQEVAPEAEPVGTVDDARVELEQKKKEWAAKMAAARAVKAAERAAAQTEPLQEVPVSA